ncbi:MAG: hypothetical protein R3288_07370 [Woeseiaceae bacterium]|nr:hypothetical protein [Woeseiaceae bacterium]
MNRTNTVATTYADAAAVIAARRPSRPVYCVYPEIYRRTAAEFAGGFPGRLLFAVKANNHPVIVNLLAAAGVRHFDCASLAEIELVKRIDAAATCYLMNPVRLDGDAAAAAEKFGCRHFVVDHANGVAPLAAEIDLGQCVVFARMAVHHASAMEDLSTKFGATPDEIPALLDAIGRAGAEPALAFNVGSGVTDPAAYAEAMAVAARVLRDAGRRVRLLDIGGGFPRRYPGFSVPPLEEYFAAIREARAALPLTADGELLAEPGRALAAPGLSVIVRVLLKKPGRLYVNDGMYGSFWELRFKGHKSYPARAYRGAALLDGRMESFRVFGPTCDSTDVLPASIELPADIDAGDYIEFGSIGAYSISGRTDFNGFTADPDIAPLADGALPPG